VAKELMALGPKSEPASSGPGEFQPAPLAQGTDDDESLPF